MELALIQVLLLALALLLLPRLLQALLLMSLVRTFNQLLFLRHLHLHLSVMNVLELLPLLFLQPAPLIVFDLANYHLFTCKQLVAPFRFECAWVWIFRPEVRLCKLSAFKFLFLTTQERLRMLLFKCFEEGALLLFAREFSLLTFHLKLQDLRE